MFYTPFISTEYMECMSKRLENLLGITNIKCTTLRPICQFTLVIKFSTPPPQRPICQFTLVGLPGCCAYLVSTDTYVFPTYRNQGVASMLQEFKHDIARDNNFTSLMCTVNTNADTYLYQKKILDRFGWKMTHSLLNRRTGNTVETYVWEFK